MGTVFFQQCREHFLVNAQVQIGILLNDGFQIGNHRFLFALKVEIKDGQSKLYQLRAVQERLGKVSPGAISFAAALVVQLQISEKVQQVFPFLWGLLYPSAKFGFQGTLLIQHMQLFNGTVHPYAVLPVIGAFVIFGSILDTDAVAAIHFTLPDGLLHTTDIYLRLVGGSHHLFDAERGEVAFRAARIAQRHTEGTFTVAVKGNRGYIFGTVGNIVGRIIGRAVMLIGIDTEYGEITGMARPFPVVSVPAELAYRGRRCKHQTHVIVIAINGKPELVASIVSIHNAYQRGVLAGNFFADNQHHRIDRTRTPRLIHIRLYRPKHAAGHVFLT